LGCRSSLTWNFPPPICPPYIRCKKARLLPHTLISCLDPSDPSVIFRAPQSRVSCFSQHLFISLKLTFLASHRSLFYTTVPPEPSARLSLYHTFLVTHVSRGQDSVPDTLPSSTGLYGEVDSPQLSPTPTIQCYPAEFCYPSIR